MDSQIGDGQVELPFALLGLMLTGHNGKTRLEPRSSLVADRYCLPFPVMAALNPDHQ
jgi:hypothetical protein